MPSGAACLSPAAMGRGLVVDDPVEAGLLHGPPHLLGSAGGPDDEGRALEPRDLPDEGAHRAAGRGDEDPVALAELRGADQSGVRRPAGHAQDAEVRGGGGEGGVDDSRVAPVHDGDRAPAVGVHDGVADPHGGTGRVRGAGADRLDHTDGVTGHRSVQLERRDVGPGVVHPTAHVGVDRQEAVADEQLSLTGGAHLDLHQGEVGVHGLAVRSADEVPLGAGRHGRPFEGEGPQDPGWALEGPCGNGCRAPSVGR